MSKRDNTIYIAGPMTGLPDFNYPAFHYAARAWRRDGWFVNNPAEGFGGNQTLPYKRYMKNAIRLLTRSGSVALLRNWQQSKGARMEVLIAQRMGYEFFDAVSGALVTPPEMDVTVVSPYSDC